MEVDEREPSAFAEVIAGERFEERGLSAPRRSDDERVLMHVARRDMRGDDAAAGHGIRPEGHSLPLALGRNERVTTPEGCPALLRARCGGVECQMKCLRYAAPEKEERRSGGEEERGCACERKVRESHRRGR